MKSKKFATILFFLCSAATVIAIPTTNSGCKVLTPEVKQDILQKKDIACALENSFMSNEKIKIFCGIADQFLSPIMDLVSVQRVKLSQEHAAGLAEGASRVGAVTCTGQTSDAGAANLNDASATVVLVKDAGVLVVTKDAGPLAKDASK